MLAGVGGLEIINLLGETIEFSGNITGLRVEQQTSQNYGRIFVGSQIGGHGNGFVRPHAGLNVALVLYCIDTDVVIPDDFDREKEIRQNLSSNPHAVLILTSELHFATFAQELSIIKTSIAQR